MLHSAPRGSLCAEAFRATEADLEAFSPGRAAAHNGHGRLGLRKAAASFFNYHVHTTLLCNEPAAAHYFPEPFILCIH